MKMLNAILVGLIIAIAILYIGDFDNQSLDEKAATQVAIIQNTRSSNDPLLLKEAETARSELQKIQTERTKIEQEKKYREQNPKEYQEQQKEKLAKNWQPIYSFFGVAIILFIFLTITQIIINKGRGESTFS